MALEKLKHFLDTENVKYLLIKHSQAYTALEIAEITHISSKEFAKTVIVKDDKNQLMMVVLPGHAKVNFDALQKATHKNELSLASELEFEQKFPGCELGAMPPFGNLFNMPVYIDRRLTQDEKMVFNAGTLSELIKLSYKDYARLVKPIVVDLET